MFASILCLVSVLTPSPRAEEDSLRWLGKIRLAELYLIGIDIDSLSAQHPPKSIGKLGNHRKRFIRKTDSHTVAMELLWVARKANYASLSEAILSVRGPNLAIEYLFSLRFKGSGAESEKAFARCFSVKDNVLRINSGALPFGSTDPGYYSEFESLSRYKPLRSLQQFDSQLAKFIKENPH